jgi:transcriptional regulator with XRE-family HTH domain
MTIEEQEASINGELIRLTRESRGWVWGDLATRSCMSVRQIRQLEEGGTSSFYSVGVKVTAAKRVASLLGLTPEQVFLTPQVNVPSEAPLVLVSQTVMVSQAESDALSSVSSHSEDTGPSSTDVPVAELPQGTVSPDPVAPVEPAPELVADLAGAKSEPAPLHDSTETKPKLSLWPILGLFVAALGVAAAMRPKPEPVALESAPPVQTITEESPAPPSVGLVPASAALTDVASAPLAVVSTKPASSSASSAAVAGATASAARALASSASATAGLGASVPRAMVPASTAALPASSPGLKTP